MSFVDKLRTQKLLSFTLMLFTLSIGIVIGTLISSGVKAAKDSSQAPGATPLVIPNPVELSNAFTQIAKQVEPSVVNISVTYNAKPTSRTRMTRLQPQPDDGDGNGGGLELISSATSAIPSGAAVACPKWAMVVKRSVPAW